MIDLGPTNFMVADHPLLEGNRAAAVLLRSSKVVEEQIDSCYGAHPVSDDENPVFRVKVGKDELMTSSNYPAESMTTRNVTVSFDEAAWQELVVQRNELLKKKYRGELSVPETRRFSLVEWKLNRLESVRYGKALSKLENLVKQQEAIAHRLMTAVGNFQS